jgi:hypothetical protein
LEYDGLKKYIPHIQVNIQFDVENQPFVDDVPRETIGFPHLPHVYPTVLAQLRVINGMN